MRSVSQIYSEAVSIRNNYLQITELNSGRSNSKLSILNLITYVVAVCIHTYEVILDLFQVRLTEVLQGRINGTPEWYALMAKKFQFNKLTERGDELFFNEDTLKIEYVTPDLNNRIIEQCAWELDENTDSLVLKVVKANESSNEINNGIPYMRLTDAELTAFKSFIQQIKFVGAKINCESYPGDIIKVVANASSPIFYNDNYITEAQALENIKQALIDFSNGFEFNSYLYYQALLDAIRKAEYIIDVGNSIKVYIQQYNQETESYNESFRLNSRSRLKSGYIRWLDENSVNTINLDNLVLIPASKMDDYISSGDNSCECSCDSCNCND